MITVTNGNFTCVDGRTSILKDIVNYHFLPGSKPLTVVESLTLANANLTKDFILEKLLPDGSTQTMSGGSISNGGRLYIGDDFLAMCYDGSRHLSVTLSSKGLEVWKSDNRIRKIFELSPTRYQSNPFARLWGLNPTSYYCLGDDVIFFYDRSVPLFPAQADSYVFDGSNLVAAFGLKECSFPLTLFPDSDDPATYLAYGSAIRALGGQLFALPKLTGYVSTPANKTAAQQLASALRKGLVTDKSSFKSPSSAPAPISETHRCALIPVSAWRDIVSTSKVLSDYKSGALTAYGGFVTLEDLLSAIASTELKMFHTCDTIGDLCEMFGERLSSLLVKLDDDFTRIIDQFNTMYGEAKKKALLSLISTTSQAINGFFVRARGAIDGLKLGENVPEFPSLPEITSLDQMLQDCIVSQGYRIGADFLRNFPMTRLFSRACVSPIDLDNMVKEHAQFFARSAFISDYDISFVQKKGKAGYKCVHKSDPQKSFILSSPKIPQDAVAAAVQMSGWDVRYSINDDLKFNDKPAFFVNIFVNQAEYNAAKDRADLQETQLREDVGEVVASEGVMKAILGQVGLTNSNTPEYRYASAVLSQFSRFRQLAKYITLKRVVPMCDSESTEEQLLSELRSLCLAYAVDNTCPELSATQISTYIGDDKSLSVVDLIHRIFWPGDTSKIALMNIAKALLAPVNSIFENLKAFYSNPALAGTVDQNFASIPSMEEKEGCKTKSYSCYKDVAPRLALQDLSINVGLTSSGEVRIFVGAFTSALFAKRRYKRVNPNSHSSVAKAIIKDMLEGCSPAFYVTLESPATYTPLLGDCSSSDEDERCGKPTKYFGIEAATFMIRSEVRLSPEITFAPSVVQPGASATVWELRNGVYQEVTYRATGSRAAADRAYQMLKLVSGDMAVSATLAAILPFITTITEHARKQAICQFGNGYTSLDCASSLGRADPYYITGLQKILDKIRSVSSPKVAKAFQDFADAIKQLESPVAKAITDKVFTLASYEATKEAMVSNPDVAPWSLMMEAV